MWTVGLRGGGVVLEQTAEPLVALEFSRERHLTERFRLIARGRHGRR